MVILPFLVHYTHHGQDSGVNFVLDPDEYLTPVTLQWCQEQLVQLNLATPPVASDFIPHLDDFRVPDYYKSLIHTARVHHGSEVDPRLELAAKPHGGYGWDPRHEVAEDLAEG